MELVEVDVQVLDGFPVTPVAGAASPAAQGEQPIRRRGHAGLCGDITNCPLSWDYATAVAVRAQVRACIGRD